MVANWPSTNIAPPKTTSATPHQLPVNASRSKRSFCCHNRNSAIGGISKPWLYSGASIHQPHIREMPSQKSHKDNANATASATITGEETRQTVPGLRSGGSDSTDIGG